MSREATILKVTSNLRNKKKWIEKTKSQTQKRNILNAKQDF
jgi:hypothetical protein